MERSFVGDKLYELGTIGGDVYAEEVAIEKVELFGELCSIVWL
jgi:hypothetical protein